MHNGTLLESIWGGAISTTQSRMSVEIQYLLKLMLPHPTVCFNASSAISYNRIIPEGIELLPALPLGDVLSEELSTDVPYGSMIVLLKEQNNKAAFSRSDISFQLGILIGDMLLGIIGDGIFPLQYETDALRVMANSYCSFIEKLAIEHRKICATSFQNGLSQSVNEYWTGPTNNTVDAKYYANKSAFFSNSQKTVWKHEPSQKCVNLSKIYNKLSNCSAWKKDIVAAVLGEIVPYSSQVYHH